MQIMNENGVILRNRGCRVNALLGLEVCLRCLVMEEEREMSTFLILTGWRVANWKIMSTPICNMLSLAR